MDARVGVVGLGAAGSAALWRLAARGADVIGFEQFRPGHDRGSSHGQSRLFRLVTSEGPQYAALAQRALRLWRELEQLTGESILELTGGLSIGQPDGDLIRSVRAVAAELDLPLHELDADQLRRRYPQHGYRPGDVALLDPNTGALRSERAIVAACAAATAAGAQIRTDAPVLDVLPGSDEVRIVTADRTFTVGTLVLAAGAWQGRLLPQLANRLTVRRALLTWFQPRPGNEEAFTPSQFPVFVHDVGTATGWGVPRLAESGGPGKFSGFGELGVKVGMHDNTGYVIDDPSANAPDVEPAELDDVTEFVARYLPGLVPVVDRAHGCMITMQPDGGFMLGIPADLPRIVVASACSGHGFKHSAAVGDIAAELALTGTTGADIRSFSPDRVAVAS